MNNNEWITDRLPDDDDGIPDFYYLVWNELGRLVHIADIKAGEAWQRVTVPEPYVKPKRFIVLVSSNGTFEVFKASEPNLLTLYASGIPTVEAAERIAAIYEQVAP